MNLLTLRVQNLRCLSLVELELNPGINVFIGGNGAGKTSVLEAVFLLSHAQSFRSGTRDTLILRGSANLSVFADLRHSDGRTAQLGLGSSSGRWSARVNGCSVSLRQLVHECAVVCFDPGAHALIAGGADIRRRYLNWGVFHVEPEFLGMWRRYERALKQRNSLLRAPNPVDQALFAPWEIELAEAATHIDGQRLLYLERLKPHLQGAASSLLPELGQLEVRYRRGWPEASSLRTLLCEQRRRDLARGHTTLGAHRADWSLVLAGAPLREHLSRGQEKLVALACVLAQAKLYAEERGEWPVVCLDDLASELDQFHQEAVVTQLSSARAQILLSGTELPPALRAASPAQFHVEQGVVKRLL